MVLEDLIDKYEFVGDVGLEKRSENIRIQWNENRIPEKVE